MRKLTEKEALDEYKEYLDKFKEEWIKNYYGGDVLEKIDPIAFHQGFSDWCDAHDIEVE